MNKSNHISNSIYKIRERESLNNFIFKSLLLLLLLLLLLFVLLKTIEIYKSFVYYTMTMHRQLLIR